MDWEVFLKKHGERLFFMGLAFLFAIIFLLAGLIPMKVPDGPLAQLVGAGVTILIGLAMLCYNKARGPSEPKEQPDPPTGGNQAGFARIMPMAVLVLLMVAIGCQVAMVKPAPPADPVCDRAEFADSLICERLKTAGIEHAEDARDILLDANDISLVLEAYTVDELSDALDKFDVYLENQLITYSVFFRFVTEDVEKARAVVNILNRRFLILQSNEFIRQSDRELLKIATMRVREASGISIK